MLSRLPGLAPIALDTWLVQDETFAAQMAYRDGLVRDRRDAVFQTEPNAEHSARELLNCLSTELPRRPGYTHKSDHIVRPDGVSVALGSDHPLIVAGRLVQEDLCLLDDRDQTHRLIAGLVCFPASWTLAEKIGRPLTAIHDPVADYDQRLAARMERIFSQLRPDQPLMRANTLIYSDPELHQPRREGTVRALNDNAARFVRVERQTLRRLAETGAIVFAIHTYIMPMVALSSEARVSLCEARPEAMPAEPT